MKGINEENELSTDEAAEACKGRGQTSGKVRSIHVLWWLLLLCYSRTNMDLVVAQCLSYVKTT